MFVCLFIHLFIHSCSHVQVVYHVYIVELHLANNCFPLSSFYSTLTFFRTYFGLGQFPHLWFSMETLQDCLWWDLLQAGQPYLTLVHPASRWLHWATRWRHSALSFASTLASSQVKYMFLRSRLMTSIQFKWASECTSVTLLLLLILLTAIILTAGSSVEIVRSAVQK